MNRARPLCSLLVLAFCCGGPASADTVAVDLQYRIDTLSWELYAEVVDTPTGNNGQYGLAAVRALIDNIDLASVDIATGIGAIDPIDAGGGNQRPAVVATAGGTIDIIYVQDLADPFSVVGGVGVGGRTLIVNGTFASALTPPAFGDDDLQRTTNGNFLNVAAPGPFGPALPWDGVTLSVLDVTPGLAGDYNDDGSVDAADYTVWRDRLGGDTSLPNDGGLGTPITSGHYDLWKTQFGASGSAAMVATAVPEPASLVTLLACGAAGVLGIRRGR